METAYPVKKRLRFRDEDDVALLREVAGQNPFESPDLWSGIQENIFILTQKNFSIKTLKDHLDLLIKLWLEKMKNLKGKSGIEEDYSEKDQLCQDIFDCMKEFRSKTEKKRKLNSSKLLGKINRDRWTDVASASHNNAETEPIEANSQELPQDILPDHSYCEPVGREELVANDLNLSDILELNSTVKTTPALTVEKMDPGSSKILRPVKCKKRKLNVQRQGLDYLERFDAQQNVLKQKEQELEERRLNVEERRLALDEDKFQLEQEEKRTRLELERERHVLESEDRKNLLEVIKRQSMLLQMLINKLQ